MSKEVQEIVSNTDFSIILQENNVKIYKENKDVIGIISNILDTNYNDEAFYIIDLAKVINQFCTWKRILNRVDIFYAVKCNSDPVILRLLANLGCNFDCASQNEISLVLSIVDDPSRIIYANPCKASSQIKYARAMDVDLLTFDSDHELYKIKLYHPRAKLILRIQADDSKSMCKFNSKFGCSLTDVESLISVAKTLDLDVCGISFHVGSGCMDSAVFETAICDSRKAFDIGKKYEYEMHILDIGGGFPGIDTESLEFEKIGNVINTSLEKYFTDIENLRIVAEPGRYMVTTSHTLVINVIGKKVTKIDNENIYVYYMNDGVYGSFNCNMFDHATPIIQPFNECKEIKYPSILFGPTCDSMDRISNKTMLPELAIGEWCYVENFGAYTSAAASNFNGFSSPRIYYVLSRTQDE